MIRPSKCIKETIDQEINLASLSQIQGADVLESILERAEQIVAFYSGWAGPDGEGDCTVKSGLSR